MRKSTSSRTTGPSIRMKYITDDIRAVGQAEQMTKFVDGCDEQIVRVQSGHSIECHPPLKHRSIGELCSCNLAVPEEIVVTVEDFYRAIAIINNMPFKVEDRRPKFNRTREGNCDLVPRR